MGNLSQHAVHTLGRRTRRALTLTTALAAALCACASSGGGDEPSGTGLGQTTGVVDPSTSSTVDSQTSDSTASTSSSGPPTSTTTTSGSSGDAETTTGEPMECGYQAEDFGMGMQELDIAPGAGTRISFSVAGLPDPSDVLSATLRFTSHDADHPGEEGEVFVNGSAPFELPANAAWDNQDGNGEIDISGTTVGGLNTVEFGGGTFAEGSFYRIGNVEIVLTAVVDACPEAPPPPPMERTVQYTEATYTERNNWVLRCGAGFEYAYTARGDEHLPLDCARLYDPDLSRSGTATFSFPDVPAAMYEVAIRSRHTTNRNPQGALFIVDGEPKRIPQNDAADFTTDIWGTKMLSGDVDVVLDSTMENESDSVIWVRLTPMQ